MKDQQPGKIDTAQLYQKAKTFLYKYGQKTALQTKETAVNVKRNVGEIKQEIKPWAAKLQQKTMALKEKTLIYWQSRNKEQKQKIMAMGAATVVMITSVVAYHQYQESLRAYEIYMEGDLIGTVRQEEELKEAIDALQQEMRRLYDMKAYIPEDQEWVEVKARDRELSSQEALVSGIKSQLGQQVQAIEIQVEGEALVTLRTKEDANKLLAKIQEPYLKDDIEYLEVDFLEAVEVVEKPAQLSEIRRLEDALQFIRTGTDEEKVYTVEPGDSSWVIAQRNEMTVDEIAEANPEINVELLSIGQEINLIVPKPYLTVTSRYYVEQTEEIPFETEDVETDSMYEGDRRITVQGQEGKRDIQAYITEKNGKVADREIIEEKIHAEPVTRVVAVGTKERPATMATGTFINPTTGRLTSPFGMRGGRRHTGIDIANSTGTPIKAADAGRVSHAGSRGAYGRLVIIDHENGYQTYYAHMDRISVSSGERVHKDQLIGTVGNTGRSTGPHLHFEVRKNGTPVNPMGYVRY
ncbi:LysM peptidoglycan-binding domain-containing M23 family metallopeptidase [Tindallia californiensis]|uniref:Murein DD-endopeptidase MepM and murein hydrolase activator NlpD, contain LysM domain n=1 Tax=Tindallia californiensis TaxID=159292 RepID=A0A1H3QJL9_9FIRM|nr:M23 family metallopeptidase [Tindallia californiensis]SDZ13165.1 Murein DD-endopeptidase MepM and murein hydrolase activator NlpD, contain LysM domain [Tindallia californiensis]